VKERFLAKLRMPDGSINPWVIAVTVTLATFMEVLDTSIANVALALSLFVMAGWDLQIDYSHAVRARMMQSFGLAFLFIPINVSAFAFVPKEKTNMGTGIINLARNIGASVGIATVTTMLQRRTQIHQAQLMEHVNPLSLAYHNTIVGTQAKLVLAGSGIHQAAAQASGMVYSTVQRQAAMLAFVDNFHMLGIVFL
jgi:MFS transporter, DHA2 family, multidrug resistance protein